MMHFENLVAQTQNIGVHRRIKNLVDSTVEHLKTEINNGVYKAGDRLPTESEMIRLFKVSRTVVREAISKLQVAELVVTRHGLGTFVVDGKGKSYYKITSADQLTLKDVLDILELRLSVESEAAALAAIRRTDFNIECMKKALDDFEKSITLDATAIASDYQFHLEIIKATNNSHFYNLLNYLGSMIIPRARLKIVHQNAVDQISYLQMIHAEHKEIFNAIKSKDAEKSRKIVSEHLIKSRDRLLSQIPSQIK
jgi:GntR family transcriptional regulator, transcriptional repressor for pyruvate dehydrogenase complex